MKITFTEGRTLYQRDIIKLFGHNTLGEERTFISFTWMSE